MKASIISLIFFMLVGCGNNNVELLSDLSETDANEIIAALHASGIEAKKQKEKKMITVMIEFPHMARAVNILKAQGLPSQIHTSLGDVFQKEGMISTPLEEKARYIYALSQELESTISQIDGVLIARVHLVLSEENSIGDETQKPSAAVFIKHLSHLDPDTVAHKIQRLVIRSVPGLTNGTPEDVNISFIESFTQSESVKWVEYMGLRITENSATKFRRLITITSLTILLVTIGIGAIIYKLVLKRSK